MATIQDILITMAIGVSFFTILIGFFGMYSPTTLALYNQHNETLTDITEQTTNIWNSTHTEAQGFTTGIESVDALAGALAGITTLTIQIGQSLLTTLITIPITFMQLIFDVIFDTITTTNPEFEDTVNNLESMIYTIVVILIVFGIVFKILLGKPDEII